MTEILVQEQWLECAICMERLNENCKMLPCQHTYCRLCLEMIYEREGSLYCAQCRKPFANPTDGNPIDALPTNLVLLSLLEQVNRNPPRRPQNEEDELLAAITNSIEDFQKDKNAGMLLKHNEELQTRLAMESSKRDVLLKNAQDMGEELNELFSSQRSLDEEVFKKENQNLLSEKEKLEMEVAILKSEQENPSYVTELISWFETNHAEFNQELKVEAQDALKGLRRAKVTQQNDSIQRRLRTLLENLNSKEKSETPKDNENIMDELNKKLNEVKFLLKNESQAGRKSHKKSENNYLSQPRQPHSPQQSHPSYYPYAHQGYNPPNPNYYAPPGPVMPVPTRPHHFMPNVYPPPLHPYYLPPNTTPYYPPGPNYPPVQPYRSFSPSSPEDSRSNYGETSHRSFGEKRGAGPRGDHRASFSNDAKHFSKNHSKVDGRDNHNKSLILPDIRDYDRVDCKINNLDLRKGENSEKLHDKKIHEKTNRLPSSRNHYANEKKTSFDDSYNYKDSYGGRGRGNSYYHRPPKSTLKTDDGFESDSSVDSTTSVSSKLSICSTPDGFYKKKHFSNKGKNRRQNRTRGNRQPSSVGPLEETCNKPESDGLKQLLYPSIEEARKKSLNVRKRFDSPLLCLGRNGVSEKAECLADIYAFEEKHPEIKVIRF